ncbi:MAG: hypothetical protein A3D89_00815 [Planctomycetes bacterium RIFCSPHIGHO2_02_FULL_52_58]|nr:MAG: hypothetical protein A3D89_00815 [Planctomycetes bacterium RIFCSPHIGHO2_02_FULL_52_58]
MCFLAHFFPKTMSTEGFLGVTLLILFFIVAGKKPIDTVNRPQNRDWPSHSIHSTDTRFT